MPFFKFVRSWWLRTLVAGLLWSRAFRWLATQIVALILLVPLLGFHVGWSRLPPAGSHPIRIFTMNVDLARASSDYVVNLVQQNQPDIVCLQETGGHPPTGLARILPGFHVDQDIHFYLASRYPILSSESAPVIMFNGHHRSLRFQHYRILANDRLRFLDVKSAGSRIGDHLAVVATVVPRDKP